VDEVDTPEVRVEMDKEGVYKKHPIDDPVHSYIVVIEMLLVCYIRHLEVEEISVNMFSDFSKTHIFFKNLTI